MRDAKCYCYSHTPEYQEVHEDLKLAIRLMEDGDYVRAGKMVYKRVRQIPAATAYALAEATTSDEERRFYTFIGDMNSRRQKGEEDHGGE